MNNSKSQIAGMPKGMDPEAKTCPFHSTGKKDAFSAKDLNKKVPTLNDWLPNFIPDISSALKMLNQPNVLFDEGYEKGKEVWAFRMAYEKWTILSGTEANEFYFNHFSDTVDALIFRLRVPTLHIKGVSFDDTEAADVITRVSRDLLIDLFGQYKTADYTHIFASITREVMERNIKGNTGKIDDFFAFFLEICIRCSTRILWGKDLYQQLPVEFIDWYGDVEEMLDLSLIFAPWLPSSKVRKANKAKKALTEALSAIIEKRRTSGQRHSDLLDGYMYANKPDGTPFNFSNNELVWLLNSIEWAAHHYPAVHGFWVFTEMLQNQGCIQKVQEEIKDVGGVHGFKKMRYLPACIKESLRLHSLIGIPRKLKTDLNYKGFTLPKGSVMAISPYLTHRDPAVYPQPNEFDPERWLRPRNIDRFSFIPGGGGQWGCIGLQFTTQLLTNVWTVLLEEYEFNFVGAIPEMQWQPMLMPPEQQEPVYFERRQEGTQRTGVEEKKSERLSVKS